MGGNKIREVDLKGKSSWGLLGAAISALIASICCVGPLVLLALGITGAWIGNLTALIAYRPIFMIVTLGFLGFAFYSVYRKPKTVTCQVGKACSHPNAKGRLKVILWMVAGLILLLLAFPYLVAYVYAKDEGAGKTEMQQVVLEIKNMTCPSCTVPVKRSLTRLDGVKEVKITLEPPEALVMYNPNKIKVEDLIKATTNIGYPSSVKQKKGTVK